jgi:DNA-binding NarL/FixJ family response regulator
MRNPIEIDYSHSRAIVQGIGERLRTVLKEDREVPASLRLQIDRLRQLEGGRSQTLRSRRRVGGLAARGCKAKEIARRADGQMIQVFR